MRVQRRRLGIRGQITLIVLLGTILTTAATLFVANRSIASYDTSQSQTQERENMQIALLVLRTEYGQNISISSDQVTQGLPAMVADSPVKDTNALSSQGFGKYPLNNDVDYVDAVQHLIGGAVSVYQCTDAKGQLLVPTGQPGCVRIATTFQAPSTASNSSSINSSRDVNAPGHPVVLYSTVYTQFCERLTHTANCLAGGSQPTAPTVSAGAFDMIHSDVEQGIAYQSDYYPLTNPQGTWIGVLAVSVPVSAIVSLQQSTTVGLVLLGVTIMIAGVILALLFASALVTTLQRAAQQVSDSSERISGIAAQQAGGAAQQVWAVNAINKALQNFTEMARDISQRTDQLALMGNQVIQRRGEIAPAQIDSILAYITRSVRDISVASRQQAVQYERMAGAMQAVIEIADQVANSSQQSTESAEQLNHVVGQLQQLVGIHRRALRVGSGVPAAEPELAAPAQPPAGWSPYGAPLGMPGAGQAMRPEMSLGMRGMAPAAPGGYPGGYRGAMPPSGPRGMPGYGAPAPMTGGRGAPGMMPPAPMPGMGGRRAGPRAGGESDMGRMPLGERGPASGGMPGPGDRRMPLPPLPGGPQMPPAPPGRMPVGQSAASGVYPRPLTPDGRSWDESGRENYGGPSRVRMPPRDGNNQR